MNQRGEACGYLGKKRLRQMPTFLREVHVTSVVDGPRTAKLVLTLVLMLCSAQEERRRPIGVRSEGKGRLREPKWGCFGWQVSSPAQGVGPPQGRGGLDLMTS